MPDISSDGCRQGSSFSSNHSVNREVSFPFEVAADNGRKSCLRCSASCIIAEVEMIHSRAVDVFT